MYVGRGALHALALELERDPTRVSVVLSDTRVAPLYAAPLVERLRGGGAPVHLVTFTSGERFKTRATKEALEDRLAELGVGRQGRVVALGGGVTGDLAGFVAATWHRGIPWIQAPTSLLAMVDAAIGGKTAVDLPHGKNLVGAFHQPESVWIDPAALSTLPAEELRYGLAEAVKTAVVADRGLFRILERGSEPLVAGSVEALEPVVEACARRKSRIVARDERDHGARAALNFGHTVAHALEGASGWSLPHGDAVAIGLAIESGLAVRHTQFPEVERLRLLGLLRALGLPSEVPASIEVERAVDFATRDKKNLDGGLRCALPRRIGSMPPGGAVTTAIAREEFARALRAG